MTDAAKKKEIPEAAGLLLILLASLAFKLLLLPMEQMIAPDEGYYIRMGQHLREGGNYGSFDFKPTKHKGQPLVPFLFSVLGGVGGDPVLTARLASIAAGLLLILVFHACARTFFTAREALASDFILAFSPFHIQASLWAMTHSFFMLAIAAALYFLLRLETGKGRAACLAGAMFWAAYMVRVEAFFFGLVFGIFFFRSRPRFALLILISFLALCLPVWIKIRYDTGLWQFTWTQGLGARGVFEWRWANALEGPLTVREFIFNYLKMLKQGFALLPVMLPLPIWVLSAFGTSEILRREPARAELFRRALLLAAVLFFFYPALKAMEPRFYFPFLMLAVIPAGAGISPIAAACRALLEGTPAQKILLRFGRVLIFTLILLTYLPGYAFLTGEFRAEPFEQKRAGEWLARNRDDSFVLLGSDQRACFYAGRQCRKFVPFAEFDTARGQGESLENFLNQSGISTIVFDSRYGKNSRPEFEKELQYLPRGRLQAGTRIEHGGHWAAVYFWNS